MFEMRNQYGDIESGYVQAALRLKGLTVAKLAKENGLAPSTLNAVWARKYPRAERIIADALGVKPCDIWPSRYLNNAKAQVA